MASSTRLQALIWIAVLLPVMCAAFSEDKPTDQRVLVLLDDLALNSGAILPKQVPIKSIAPGVELYNSVQENAVFLFREWYMSHCGRGYELDFKLADDSKLALQKYGEYLYDALILFAPSVEGHLGGNLDVAAILDFVDSGHDLILAADTHTSDLIRDIATECGVDFDEDMEAVVVDHINFAVQGESDHSLIVGDKFIKSDVILGKDGIKDPILFRGIGHSVNSASDLVVTVLSASPSAFSTPPNAVLTAPPALTGTSISLVSVVQARNSARILISGSLDLFSDKFFRSAVQKFGSSSRSASGNEKLAVELSKWTFHERGHLKAANVHHNKIGEKDEPAMYRITDHLEYSLQIHEWTGKEWKPYQADDVQVQFYMMSPYVLKTLDHNGKGLYYTSFQVPDVYGVFQFKVEYKRLGYTSLTLSKQIPVRPFRHNEYERFIKAAYPYYGGAFSMMTGFFVFGIVFLYHK